jgi:hypothetical protein
MARGRAFDDQQASVAGYMIAMLGPIVVAALLVPLREDLVTTNLALILVVVVVLAAVAGGRGAGAVAAVVAVIAYDFFLTRPYLSFRIDSADDVETAVILLVIGLIVGQLVTITRRSRVAAERGSDEVQRIHRLAELGAAGGDADEMTKATERELIGLLDLEACWFEPAPYEPMVARLERSGAVVGAPLRVVDGGFALPKDGIELQVLGRGREYGRFVLVGKANRGASVEQRITAVTLVDQLGAALAASDAEPRPGG